MKESITKTSFLRFKSNIITYIAIGLMCGLFFILVSALSFIDELIFILAIPLLALPMLFASHIASYLLEMDQQVTAGSFFRYFVSFYRPQFRGAFRAILSFLISLAVYFCLMMLSYFVLFFVFKGHYGDTFTNAVNNFIALYTSGATYEELLSSLKENGGVLLTFVSFIAAMPLPVSIVTFICFTSYNSIALYYRANLASGAPSLLRLGISIAYRNSRKTMLKDWLKLNFWLILLPLIGCAVAGAICVFGTRTYTLLPPAVTVGAFVPLVFFLPFYFPNMEVLYHRYEESFKEGNKKAIEIFLERISNSIELSEEEKRKLEESFKDDSEKNE